MRVLLLSYSLGNGGAPKVVHDIAAQLQSFSPIEYVGVGYLAPPAERVPEIRSDGITVTYFGETGFTLSSLKYYIDNHGIDILHTHMMVGNVFGRIIGRLSDVSIISTLHTEYKKRSLLAKWGDRLTAPFADKNVAVAASVRRTLPIGFECGFAELSTIHNGIDFEVIEEAANIEWDELGWSSRVDRDNPLIVSVGRYGPKKCPEDLIYAMEHVLEEYSNATLVFAGERGDNHPLKTLARKRGIDHSVVCLGHIDNPCPLYHHADVVVFPSISEGFSIAMLEALAVANQIVATDIPSFREALGKDYPLTKPHNRAMLGKDINDRLRNPEHFAKSLNIARKRAKSNFSVKSCANSYLNIYRETLAEV